MQNIATKPNITVSCNFKDSIVYKLNKWLAKYGVKTTIRQSGKRYARGNICPRKIDFNMYHYNYTALFSSIYIMSYIGYVTFYYSTKQHILARLQMLDQLLKGIYWANRFSRNFIFHRFAFLFSKFLFMNSTFWFYHSRLQMPKAYWCNDKEDIKFNHTHATPELVTEELYMKDFKSNILLQSTSASKSTQEWYRETSSNKLRFLYWLSTCVEFSVLSIHIQIYYILKWSSNGPIQYLWKQ